jgi:hypothetical protein
MTAQLLIPEEVKWSADKPPIRSWFLMANIERYLPRFLLLVQSSYSSHSHNIKFGLVSPLLIRKSIWESLSQNSCAGLQSGNFGTAWKFPLHGRSIHHFWRLYLKYIFHSFRNDDFNALCRPNGRPLWSKAHIYDPLLAYNSLQHCLCLLSKLCRIFGFSLHCWTNDLRTHLNFSQIFIIM